MDGKIDAAMGLAIQEAYRGAAFVSPNPKVGCVVLDSSGKQISSGYHQVYGGPHAEVEALKNLEPHQLKDAHVIVTLEPCAHQGKTPSCARMLATLPIKKVTFGLVDPNPLVSGKGRQILVDAGIQAEEYQGSLKPDLEELCEEFLVNQTQKRVFVAMKVAQSSDGFVAQNNQESVWITGVESREYVQHIRSHYDAILVGRQTVVVDNPQLNIRLPGLHKKNHVVVWGSANKLQQLSRDLKLFKLHDSEHLHFESGDLKSVLTRLFDKGIRSVLVEGGAQTFSEFLRLKLVDRLHLFTAPTLLGHGHKWGDPKGFVVSKTKTFGQDLYQSFRPQNSMTL